MFNSGWANNCGVELFTHGWVRCPEEDIEQGGGQSKGNQRYKDILHHKRLLREDEELLAVVIAALSNGVIK